MEQSDILEIIHDRMWFLRTYKQEVATPDILQQAHTEITRLRAAFNERLVATVKPLKWVERNGFFSAGPYRIKAGGWYWSLQFIDAAKGRVTSHPSIEDAKAAAQADHIERSLVANNITTAASVRDDALLEAAKEIERRLELLLGQDAVAPTSGEIGVYRICHDAILSLVSSTKDNERKEN